MPSSDSQPRRRWRRLVLPAALLLAAALLASSTSYESWSSLYDADYVGSETCGKCHTHVYEQWKGSPHALMTRRASETSVVGDFSGTEWRLPQRWRRTAADNEPAARMTRRGDEFVMELRDPRTGGFHPFRVDWVIGYQYRQTYLTEEKDGVLRRLPIEWSTERKEFFAYWNEQERSAQSVPDLWVQMHTQNSAWNLFCARCHTTHLEILDKDAGHRRALTRWTEPGIACEACHGPGSQHASYFAGNYVNRLVAFANGRLRGQPVAYMANGPKLTKGQDLSVCARCHAPDITMQATEIYRTYEPGYSKEGKINDLTPWMREVPLTPGRKDPTVEVWDDGRPRGIGMIPRSFLESACWQKARPSCYDCHDPHANREPRTPGILEPGPVSDGYCLRCHETLKEKVAQHTKHAPGTPGSRCYDCHMPHVIEKFTSGVWGFTRTHWMSSIPRPEDTVKHGATGSPNACNECHTKEGAAWAVDQMQRLWPKK